MIQIITTGGTIEGLEYDKYEDAPNRSPVTIYEHLNLIDNIPDVQPKKSFQKTVAL
ncbi:hypothetical protein WIW50_15595 [Flavobacteriaceae bacterium 3-367]|uniref:hypothetical protein n=1 Tax=Eudoraea algarum TaxID=3417568 RepID=UPI0032812561